MLDARMTDPGRKEMTIVLKYGTDIEIVIEISKLLRATIVTARR